VIPPHSILRVETREDVHLKCLLLLSDYNRNWKVLTNFRNTPQFHESTLSGSRSVRHGRWKHRRGEGVETFF
jgi:hypothetical protein